MIKKIRRNKVAVTIISVILGMIIVFSVNFILWLLQFIVAKPLIVTLKGKVAATILLTLVENIFRHK